MQTRKTWLSGALPYAAAFVAVASATALLVLSKKKVAAPPTKNPPGPAVTPLPPLTGPVLPPHGRLLVVGGKDAHGLATALVPELQGIELAEQIPSSPAMVTVYDGADTLYPIESFAKGVEEHGLPPEATNLAGQGRPDVVVVMLGMYDAAYGPVDDVVKYTVSLGRALSQAARDHVPNVIWILPWNPDLAFQKEMQAKIGAAATSSAPGRVLAMTPDYSRVDMDDAVTPSEAGYREIAKEVSSILLSWYRAHPGQAAA